MGLAGGRDTGAPRSYGVPVALGDAGRVVPLRAAARAAVPAPLGVEALLAQTREGTPRLTPRQARLAAQRGALLVDTRTETPASRSRASCQGALVIDRTVLEWRLDPAGPHAVPEAVDHDVQVVVVCRQGYSSSLAAASLRAVGLHRATDMVGGVQAWVAAGLPVTDGPADVRR